MELRYPWVLIILIITLLAIVFIKSRKSEEYKKGKKVANTKYVKNEQYYKNIVKKYKTYSYLIKGVSIITIIISFVLLARPSKEDVLNNPKYNRDIILCMDVSTSVSEVNKELVDKLKDTVKNLKGERFGISIFNTSSVLIVPLTDDYDYVISTLDKLKEALATYGQGYDYGKEDFLELRGYIQNGTLVGNEERGSSLIGDGLASSVYDFIDLDKDKERSRIIIFSTDNDLAGTPMVTLKDAARTL